MKWISVLLMYTINTIFLHITVSYYIGLENKETNKKHNNKKSKIDECKETFT